MRGIGLSIVMGLGLVNSPALADTPQKSGFGASDLAAAARTADTSVVALARETDRLRLAMAYDTALGLSTRSQAERAVLLAALPTGEGAGDLRVQWFMAGAIAQPSKGTTTILYHPLARGTLALDWVKEGDSWRIAHAFLSSSGPAQWLVVDDSWRKALVNDYVNARAYPGDVGPAWVRLESDTWLAGLARALRNPARRSGIDVAWALIRDGRTQKVGGGSIDLISGGTRSTYVPVAAIDRKDGGSAVIFGSPLLPQLLITADFDASATPKLERITLINLDNAGKGNTK